MTVAELIAELQKWPQDAKVWAEGCDCWGKVNRVDEVPPEIEGGGVLVGVFDGVEGK